MLNQNLSDEKIVVEIRELVNGIDNFKEDIDSYCDFLKDMFLAGSGRN